MIEYCNGEIQVSCDCCGQLCNWWQERTVNGKVTKQYVTYEEIDGIQVCSECLEDGYYQEYLKETSR